MDHSTMDHSTMDHSTMEMDDSMSMSSSSSGFCEGMAMTMYMDGFNFGLSGGKSCLNLWFVSWTLDTVGKYVGAMIGVFLLGVSIEGISKGRQLWIRRARNEGWSACSVRASVMLIHGVQAFLGYMLMLVTMTYSGELVIMVVAGLAAGSASFYTYDDLISGKHVTTSPCCNFIAEQTIESFPPGTKGVTNYSDGTPENVVSCCDQTSNGEGDPLAGNRN